VIDIRCMWRDKEAKLIDARHADNIVYDEGGGVLSLSRHLGTATDGLRRVEKDRMRSNTFVR